MGDVLLRRTRLALTAAREVTRGRRPRRAGRRGAGTSSTRESTPRARRGGGIPPLRGRRRGCRRLEARPACPVLLAVLLLLVAAPAAEARWFAAEPIDGAGARPVVDLGIEEGGGVVYVKDGVAWLSRLGSRGWGAPAALSGPNTTEAAVAAGQRRLAAAWIQDGNVVGTLVGAPAVPLSAGGGASDLAIEMGVNGVAYAVWTQNGDVRAAQLRDATWTAVPAPLDVDPAATATEPEVAVAADGSALVAWTEAGHVSPAASTERRCRRFRRTPERATRRRSTSSTTARTPGWRSARARTASRARLRASTFEAPYALDRGIDSGGPDVP